MHLFSSKHLKCIETTLLLHKCQYYNVFHSAGNEIYCTNLLIKASMDFIRKHCIWVIVKVMWLFAMAVMPEHTMGNWVVQWFRQTWIIKQLVAVKTHDNWHMYSAIGSICQWHRTYMHWLYSHCENLGVSGRSLHLLLQ